MEDYSDYMCNVMTVFQMDLQGTNNASVYMSLLMVHLGKPKEVLGDGGGAALDLHQWELIFSCQQDVFLVVAHCCQVYAPNEIDIRDTEQR